MNKKNILPYGMLFPMIILMVGLVFYPIMVTFTYSLKHMKLTEPNLDSFAGIDNYIKIFKDSSFWYSLQNSLIVLVVTIILACVIGLCFGVLINVDTKIKGVLTALAIIPWALPPVVNGVIWRWIFHPSFGFINKFLLEIGVISEPIQWLSERFLVVLAAAIVLAWRSIPFAAVVFLSALQGIPKQLYESAKIDGCGTFARFRKITLPLLRPSFVIILTTTSINAINIFDEIVSLSGYGNVSKTLMIETYLKTFRFFDFGSGSALIYITMLAVSILGLFYVVKVNKEVEYL